jgi:hypothetical protein
VEGWLQTEPDVTAKALMQRLCKQFPDVYPTAAQLRTLQRRVQLWRNEQVKLRWTPKFRQVVKVKPAL